MPPKGPKATPKAGAKKGAPSAMLSKLKMKMELQQQEEQRWREEQEAEEKRLREEERLAKEQAKFEAEEAERERARKKQEERLQKKTKKVAVNHALERMKAAGMIVPDVEKIREEEKTKPKEAPAPRPKKAVKHSDPSAAAATAAAAPTPPESDDDDEPEEPLNLDDLVTEPTESDLELDEDDWEAETDREVRRDERHKKNIAVREERTRRAANWEKEKAARKAQRKAAKAEAARQERAKQLRSPIICVLGHVDTGKTSLLDRIRTGRVDSQDRTRASDVQGGEAGGITQQIGATFLPREALEIETEHLNAKKNWPMNIPGLLVIDTPGHESFTNLRSRGSGICDMAILVVDITAGLQRQTIESIRLLRDRKCPFIVALNKVDRLNGWKPQTDADIQESLSKQDRNAQVRLTEAVDNLRNELSAEGFNSALYYELDNIKEMRRTISIVPTSAKSGEGISDLLLLEVHLIQQLMEQNVRNREELECTVLEVKPIPGHGFTIDVILINGELHEGDHICVAGDSEPIFTSIRALLTPEPMRESRVKSEYVHHKTIHAAMGVKIVANDLEHAVPGTPLFVVGPNDKREDVAAQVMSEQTSIKESLSPDGIGVYVQSSTLGALEALMRFLSEQKVPICGYGIGTIRKSHMRQVVSVRDKSPRYGIILAFDVDVQPEAEEMAAKAHIRIFKAPVIYHLFDAFTRYMEEFTAAEKAALKDKLIFPVELEITDDAFHKTRPIIMPVRVKRGQLRPGTPLLALRNGEKDKQVLLGTVMSMEHNHSAVEKALPGEELAVKINNDATGASYGVQFFKSDPIICKPTTDSILAIQKFDDELTDDDRELFKRIVRVLKVPMPLGMAPY